MKPERIESIPINEIRVVNPRSRNKVTFQNIVLNIGRIGLKKPVTVFRRELEGDGTRYDLVCGQGRLEAIASLGDTVIPAIVIEAPPEDRYLMSLVENIARRRPSNSELLREVRSLKERGYKSREIAAKIGVDVTYINGVIHLLRRGEERLIARVDSGAVPLSVAIKIATCSNEEVQRALADAYDKGELRGAKLHAVQTLITRRLAKERGDAGKTGLQISEKDLVREYERQTERQKALIRRAEIVAQRLALLSSALKRLLKDEHFVTLIRAESLARMPEALAKRLA